LALKRFRRGGSSGRADRSKLRLERKSSKLGLEGAVCRENLKDKVPEALSRLKSRGREGWSLVRGREREREEHERWGSREEEGFLSLPLAAKEAEIQR